MIPCVREHNEEECGNAQAATTFSCVAAFAFMASASGDIITRHVKEPEDQGRSLDGEERRLYTQPTQRREMTFKCPDTVWTEEAGVVQMPRHSVDREEKILLARDL